MRAKISSISEWVVSEGQIVIKLVMYAGLHRFWAPTITVIDHTTMWLRDKV